jgi:hypothetical protein
MTNTAITSHVVGAVAPLTWATKSGKARAAHSATAQALAPRAARIGAARADDLQAFRRGQYGRVLRDIDGALTGAAREAVLESMRAKLTRMVDGAPMIPAGDPLTRKDKDTAKALGAALRELVGGQFTNSKGKTIKCAKLLQEFAEVFTVWVAEMDAAAETATATETVA